jgi:hypothetical protein
MINQPPASVGILLVLLIATQVLTCNGCWLRSAAQGRLRFAVNSLLLCTTMCVENVHYCIERLLL